jgi:ABC-type nickel/cobalt efflux system permease component RcnA
MSLINLLSIIALGFFLGMRHATDPDHVIAITTIVSRYRKVGHAAWIGALWGLGHTLTIFAVGGGIILFGWVIPARVGLSMELSVGLMLILLGVLNLTGMLQWVSERFASTQVLSSNIHSHPHTHGDYIHTHPHGHEPEAHTHSPEKTPLGWFDRQFGRMGFYQLLRPLVVGLVHGTAAIAVPFVFAGRTSPRIHRGFRLASGLISLGFGLFLTYQTGFVGGLFTGHPAWTPR